MRKYIIGGIAGLVIGMSGMAMASSTVSAYLSNANFVFNGQSKSLDSGYVALNYGGHLYVPARFVAENMGGTVTWDDSTQTVGITTGSGTSSSSGSSSGSIPSTTVGNFTISNYSSKTSSGQTEVIGVIKNNSTADVLMMTVQVDFYASGGQLLGTGEDVVSNLKAGSSATFDALSDADYSGAAYYAFEVKGVVNN